MKKLGRNRSCRQASSPERALDGLLNSSSGLFRLMLHGLLCIVALILGFRLSREALLVVDSFKLHDGTFFRRSVTELYGGGNGIALWFPYVKEAGEGSTSSLPHPAQLQAGISLPPGRKSSRVHVGRHEILVRPWPHPDPVQTIVAHRLMDLVQHEQQRSYGLEQRRQLLVITPTYVRTFQAVHLTCLIHSLRVVPSPLIWIVVEAGGVSNETAALLSSSQLSFYHLYLQEAMPAVWEERQQLDARLRIEGLRFIREHRLDGIVLFADESNTHSLDLFDEVQKVNWIGTFSVGVLSHSGLQEFLIEDSEAAHDDLLVGAKQIEGSSISLPLQGPVCNSTRHTVGWFAPSRNETRTSSQDFKPTADLEWAGFALNAKLLWEEYDKPPWIRSWTELFGESGTFFRNPLDFVKNASFVEPLGNCGRDVLMWWLRVEARADSKFPSRWLLDAALEIVVPSKRTPWMYPPVGHPFSLPPLLPLSSDITNQFEKKSNKQGVGGGKGRRGPQHGEDRKQSLIHNTLGIQQALQILVDTAKGS